MTAIGNNGFSCASQATLPTWVWRDRVEAQLLFDLCRVVGQIPKDNVVGNAELTAIISIGDVKSFYTVSEDRKTMSFNKT